MKTEHLSPDDLALYVMDALDPEPAAALEAHVAACPACAAALAREAKVEAAMYEIGAAIAKPLARPKRGLRRATATIAAASCACALAAAYLGWIARPGHGGAARAAERPAMVSCPPERSWAAASCHTRARLMGLYVEDPPRSAAIPVYEDFGRAGAPAPHR